MVRCSFRTKYKSRVYRLIQRRRIRNELKRRIAERALPPPPPRAKKMRLRAFRHKIPFKRPLSRKTSRFIGVSFYKAIGRWKAQIHSKGSDYYLGNFDSEVEAALAYDKACVKLRGTKAILNFTKKNLPDKKR